MYLLSGLEHLSLYTSRFSCHAGDLAKLDLGSLVEVPSLRTLAINGGCLSFRFLEQLTQLSALKLNDPEPLPGTELYVFHLPVSLTKLELQINEWYQEGLEGVAAPLMPALQEFEGHLRSLTLDPPFVHEFGNGPGLPSAGLASLQQVTHLKLGLVKDTPVCSQPAFSCLQFLQLDILDWPSGSYPQLDLAGCPKLQSLSLSYSLQELDDEGCVIDLQGIIGNSAPVLHLELDVWMDMKAFADFSGWALKAVSIGTQPRACNSYRDWRVMHSAHDIVGALAGYLPMRNVTVDGQRIL